MEHPLLDDLHLIERRLLEGDLLGMQALQSKLLVELLSFLKDNDLNPVDLEVLTSALYQKMTNIIERIKNKKRQIEHYLESSYQTKELPACQFFYVSAARGSIKNPSILLGEEFP